VLGKRRRRQKQTKSRRKIEGKAGLIDHKTIKKKKKKKKNKRKNHGKGEGILTKNTKQSTPNKEERLRG